MLLGRGDTLQRSELKRGDVANVRVVGRIMTFAGREDALERSDLNVERKIEGS